MELTITVQPDGNLTAKNDNLTITTSIKFGRAVDDKNKEWNVHYVDFSVTTPASQVGILKEDYVNSSKLKIVKFMAENFYNHMFFKSSNNKSDALYKALLNVKGRDITLIPKLRLI